MWRMCYTIIRNIFKLPGALHEMNKLIKNSEEHPENYSEEENYKYVQYVVDVMKKTGHIKTEVFGHENLPKEGGYMMYPNHQGKYDAYGIISVHEKPCSFVMDINKSNGIFIKQIVDTLKGKRLNKQSNKQAMTIINEMAKDVEAGRKYILFPEGIFDNKKKNSLIEFKAGCFKISLKTKTPIVPVVLIDSYKVYNSWETGEIKTQVHFLNPIYWDEYKDMNTRQIAELVKSRIANKIEEVC
ncbi:MAG: 1-acyl-sn-glycerol-3-phosphate acyltransferase [Clostridia bacterium]|nr:1-acyl-sn-glycerol-3-phosphate acyltransferase [Clostridia bacterium]